MNYLRIFGLFIIALNFTACAVDEEDSSAPGSPDQDLDGNWYGNTSQAYFVHFNISKKFDSLFIVKYQFTYRIDDEVEEVIRQDQSGISFVENDTMSFEYPDKVKVKGKFWSTNYLSGIFSVFKSGEWYDFEFTASKFGNPHNIHTAPFFGFHTDGVYHSGYTYINGYEPGFDTILKDDKVVFTSNINLIPHGQQEEEKLFEVRIGALDNDYSSQDFRDIIKPGPVPFSQNAGNGVEIIYRDPGDGYRLYSTSLGPANQEGSIFEISEVRLLSGSDTTYLLNKVLVNFECKLYDASGNEKFAQFGLFIGFFEGKFE